MLALTARSIVRVGFIDKDISVPGRPNLYTGPNPSVLANAPISTNVRNLDSSRYDMHDKKAIGKTLSIKTNLEPAMLIIHKLGPHVCWVHQPNNKKSHLN